MPKAKNLPLAVRAVIAEGARIGLGSCPLCGCAIVIDPNDTVDVYQKHLDWHGENDARPESEGDSERG